MPFFILTNLYFDNLFCSFITKTNASISLFVFWFSEVYVPTYGLEVEYFAYPTTMLIVDIILGNLQMYLFLLLPISEVPNIPAFCH